MTGSAVEYTWLEAADQSGMDNVFGLISSVPSSLTKPAIRGVIDKVGASPNTTQAFAMTMVLITCLEIFGGKHQLSQSISPHV